ncbi:hypothetical protein IAT38_002874 [Cryptococcus sp. DSM 104549]
MSALTTAILLPLLALLATPIAAAPSSPPATLLVSSVPPGHFAADRQYISDCLKSSYYGSYGGSQAWQDHIFIPSSDCLEGRDALDGFSEGSLVALDVIAAPEDGRLVWVGHAGVTGAKLYEMEEAWELIASRAAELALSSREGDAAQQVLSSHSKAAAHPHSIQRLHQTRASLLLHVPSSYLAIIDTLLPHNLVPVALPVSPLPVSLSDNMWEPVPADAVKLLANLTKHLKFSPEVDRIVSEGIELNQIRRDVRWLTGEAPSGIESRHSFTEGAVKAAHWIKSKVEATGANCHLQPFLSGFAPNVICHYPSLLNSTEHVILSAHYDSRGSWGSTRAPGGDDDGSGTGHLLSVAHAIGNAGVEFERSVTLAFFAGEEQGLLGSHAYAEYLHSQNTTILLQVQADMLAYHAPGETLQLGLPETIHLPEASYLIGNLSHLYSPELVVGSTAACCSDHQSFVSYGFPATQVFERNGDIVDPMYHNSGDLSQREGYDFEQIVAIAKVTLSALLTVAGYRIVEA